MLRVTFIDVNNRLGMSRLQPLSVECIYQPIAEFYTVSLALTHQLKGENGNTYYRKQCDSHCGSKYCDPSLETLAYRNSPHRRGRGCPSTSRCSDSVHCRLQLHA